MKLLLQFLVFLALLLAGAYARTRPTTIASRPAQAALPGLQPVPVSPSVLRLATGAKSLASSNKKPL